MTLLVLSLATILIYQQVIKHLLKQRKEHAQDVAMGKTVVPTIR